jgi:hypothetical protein
MSDRESLDLFRVEQPKRERPATAPYQKSSPTSAMGAEKIAPVFSGNRLACFRAIAAADMSGGITRKQIAARYFDNQQQYVTGPVSVLIDELGYVMQEPARDNAGAIVTRTDEKGVQHIVPKRIEGSAVLRLTPKGQAVARKSA